LRLEIFGTNFAEKTSNFAEKNFKFQRFVWKKTFANSQNLRRKLEKVYKCFNEYTGCPTWNYNE